MCVYDEVCFRFSLFFPKMWKRLIQETSPERGQRGKQGFGKTVRHLGNLVRHLKKPVFYLGNLVRNLEKAVGQC